MLFGAFFIVLYPSPLSPVKATHREEIAGITQKDAERASPQGSFDKRYEFKGTNIEETIGYVDRLGEELRAARLNAKARAQGEFVPTAESSDAKRHEKAIAAEIDEICRLAVRKFPPEAIKELVKLFALHKVTEPGPHADIYSSSSMLTGVLDKMKRLSYTVDLDSSR